MNTAELKNQLHKLIVETDDLDVLTKIQSYFGQLKSNNSDWWDELGDSAKKEIEEGVQQADNGDLIDHNDARKRIDNFFKKHG
jgi:hypothetical protein